jgi:predicted heme/steroid binding protein
MTTSTLNRVLFRTIVLVFLFHVVSFSQGTKFTHVATASNIFFDYTIIDNAALNGNPNAVFFVTPNWDPQGVGGIYDTSAIGVWYTGSNWSIFNQDISNMPEGAAFNILIPSGGQAFVHTANSSNISGNTTAIDNAALNGNPNAIFFVTQNWNPSGTGGVYNNSEIGVWYDGSHWGIFNQNLSTMPDGASFNVLIPSGTDMFVHTATGANIISNWTVIDNPSLNGNADAIFFVTQNWNPSGVGGVYDASPIGVWYDGSNWSVFDQDLSDMPLGASFNIYLASGVATGIDSRNDLSVQNFKLEQNYPNPFNPSTKIQYQIPGAGHVKIDVVDILGRYITTLVNDDKFAGQYEVTFNAGNLPSGIYFYHMQSGQYSQTKKMMLLK